MRQALQIFKKDVRYLRYEIAVALLTAVSFVLGEIPRLQAALPGYLTEFGFPLLPIAGWILITRVIQAEALPGDRQFWRTRPYDWKSLWGAKALFILTFVNLPKLVADAVIVHSFGFSLRAELPGLLWSQVLLTAAFILPIAAVSALTVGFPTLALATFILGVGLMFISGTALGPLDWVGHSSGVAVLTLAAFATVLWQYGRRRVWVAYVIAVAGWVFMIYASTSIRPEAAIAVESRLSPRRVDPSAVRIRFDSARRSQARALLTGASVQIQIPLEIADVPDGMEAKLDGFSVRVLAPEGTMWPPRDLPDTYLRGGRDSTIFLTAGELFYRSVKNEPVRFRGSAYITLLGNRRTAQVGRARTYVPGAGVCTMEAQFLMCRYPFRSPPLMLSSPSAVASDVVSDPISYSPFPAELGISPMGMSRHILNPSEQLETATIVIQEPLAHIRREFEIGGLRLADFEVTQKH